MPFAQALRVPTLGDRFMSGLGRYYGLPHSNVGTIANPSGNMDATPFPVGQTISLAALVCNVTVGGAGAFARMAVYNDNGQGYPNSLLVDTGQLDASTTGIKEFTVGTWVTNNIGSVLSPGLYWICAGPQGNSVTFSSFGSNVTLPWIYGKTNSDVFPASFPCSYILTGIVGAYPATCPTNLNSGTSGINMSIKIA